MSSGPPIWSLISQMLLSQLPGILVSLFAIIISISLWRTAPRAALWAVVASGLNLVLCFVFPVVWAFLQQSAVHSGQFASRSWMFTVSSIVFSILHAVVYLMLLVGVFIGRAPAPPR